MHLLQRGSCCWLRRGYVQFRLEAPFFCTCTVLVGLNNRGIQGEFIKFGFEAEHPEDIVKYPVIDPFTEAAVYRIPRALTFRKVTPWGTASCNPYHPIEHHTVVL